ncbi:IS5 family transposase [Hoeflea sp.]|uniref:IS5 family transposase n=1 Tax=Hoeflea sp. TaxID=1940281 RepID=UPI003B020346
MPWTDTARLTYNRKTDRYPSDVTNEEWAILEPMVPPARPGGRPRTADMREVINAIFYIGSTGCQWRALPIDFPPMTTVQGYFYAWRNAGILEAMNDLLVTAARELEGRDAQPTAGVIDSQSVKTTESGGVCGYDAGKKTKGRKRHIVTDVLGLLLVIIVHAANIQDRDGAPDVLKAVGKKFPWLRHIFADGGYAGDKLRQTMGNKWTLEIVKRPGAVKGFVLLPMRWVVERTFAWLGRCRRLAKDWENTVESSTAWAHIARPYVRFYR